MMILYLSFGVADGVEREAMFGRRGEKLTARDRSTDPGKVDWRGSVVALPGLFWLAPPGPRVPPPQPTKKATERSKAERSNALAVTKVLHVIAWTMRRIRHHLYPLLP